MSRKKQRIWDKIRRGEAVTVEEIQELLAGDLSAEELHDIDDCIIADDLVVVERFGNFPEFPPRHYPPHVDVKNIFSTKGLEERLGHPLTPLHKQRLEGFQRSLGITQETPNDFNSDTE